MKTALLIGAGFSKNWEGWLAKEAFEFLLGCKEIQNDRQLLNMLWQFQNDGFESVLAALHKENEFFPDERVKNQLETFQRSGKSDSPAPGSRDGWFTQTCNWVGRVSTLRHKKTLPHRQGLLFLSFWTTSGLG